MVMEKSYVVRGWWGAAGGEEEELSREGRGGERTLDLCPGNGPSSWKTERGGGGKKWIRVMVERRELQTALPSRLPLS